MAPDLADYKTDVWVDWCPGCGNYGILAAMHKALAELQLPPEKTVIVSGIGCSGKTPHFIKVNGVHAIHGRAIPYAMGIKLANPRLTVIVNGGDGDLLGIGAGHFVALGRRNLDVTVILHDNRVYGLTKGQAAPTLERGLMPKALPRPNIQDAVNPIALALSSGFTFVARGYSLMTEHLKELIKMAVRHRGAAFIDVLQPCITYNDIHTPEYYRGRIYRVEESGWDPVVKDPVERRDKLLEALRRSMENGDKIPVGLFYQDPTRDIMEDRIAGRLPSYLANPPAAQKIEDDGKPVITEKIFRRIFAAYFVKTE
ncbi:MAG: 2-oxoacid:ferredoxin oxidoreductase subunit beta [Nitrososphaerota archaeon]